MLKTQRGPTVFTALAMHFSGVLWFYLLLYFSGVLDLDRYGALYAASALAATLISTITSPFLNRRDSAEEQASTFEPRPPRVRNYLALAIGWFMVLWLCGRLMEWISASFGGEVRWPVTNIAATAVLALVSLTAALLLAVMHLRAYRKLTRARRQLPTDAH